MENVNPYPNREYPYLIPPQGKDIDLFTITGLKIAFGYKRIIFGGRGDYVEFEFEQINHSNIYIPESVEWRLKHDFCYYWEYRSIDEAHIKIYFQKKSVSYADYIINKFYISPQNLYIMNIMNTINIVKKINQNKKTRKQTTLNHSANEN